MSGESLLSDIAADWGLWAQYLHHGGEMSREEWEAMGSDEREDARDVAMAQAALAEWERQGRPTVSL